MSEVTIRDIAQEAGLSISSVSRILNGGKGHVYPQETFDRVNAIAVRLGYRPNIAARMLSQGTRTMIGMTVHFTEHPYLNRFLVAVHRELLKHKYDPVLLDAEHLVAENSAQPFPPPHMLAGLISAGIDMQSCWPKSYAAIAEHIPMVALQPVCSDAAKCLDVVQVDFYNAYLQALDHLMRLGHRHIAYLGVMNRPLPSDRSKNKGWLDAAKHHKLPTKYTLTWRVNKTAAPKPNGDEADSDDFIYQAESQRVFEEVVQQLTSFPEKITALICASDEVAIGLQSYLQAQGWQLPRDLSIIGYDGISMGEYVYPALTTIAPNYNRMAEVAAQVLLDRISQRTLASSSQRVEYKVDPELILRASTAKSATQ